MQVWVMTVKLERGAALLLLEKLIRIIFHALIRPVTIDHLQHYWSSVSFYKYSEFKMINAGSWGDISTEYT